MVSSAWGALCSLACSKAVVWEKSTSLADAFIMRVTQPVEATGRNRRSQHRQRNNPLTSRGKILGSQACTKHKILSSIIKEQAFSHHNAQNLHYLGGCGPPGASEKLHTHRQNACAPPPRPPLPHPPPTQCMTQRTWTAPHPLHTWLTTPSPDLMLSRREASHPLQLRHSTRRRA